MKRRILCLMLSALMILTVIPVMSLSAFADDGQSAQQSSDPGVGTYDYYADKGMWYGTGAGYVNTQAEVTTGKELTPLMSFVDMTHVPEETEWRQQIDPNMGLHIANSDDVLVLYPWNSRNEPYYNNTSGVGTSGTHAYVRISGGQLAGSFYPFTPAAGSEPSPASNIVSRDSYGVLQYVGANANMRPGASAYISGTVLVTSSFANTRATSANEVGDYWSLMRGAAAFGSEALGDDYSKLIDDYMDPSVNADAKYSMEHVARIYNGSGIDLGSATSKSLQYINLFAMGMQTYVDGNPDAQLSVASLDYADGGVLKGVSFNGTQAKAIVDGSELGTRATSASAYVSVSYTAADTADMGWKMMNAETGLVTRNDTGVALSQEQAITLVPKASQISQSLFIRVYNKELTDEQFKQNHLADLMYYYNIDLKERQASFFEQYYDFAMTLDIGLRDNKNELSRQTRVINILNAMVEGQTDFDEFTESEEDNTLDYNKNANFVKYEKLWYDNGHMQMFFDLTDLNAAGNTVALSDNPTVEQLNAAKFVTGDQILPNANGKHYFIKAESGKYAGYFFMLGAPNGLMTDPDTGGFLAGGNRAGNIQITSDGLLDCYAPFHVYSTYAAGVYVNYAFLPEVLGQTFSGTANLGDTAPVITALAKGDKEAGYTGSYGHFSFDMTAKIGGSGLNGTDIGYLQYDFDKNGTNELDFRNMLYNMVMFNIGGGIGSVQVNDSNKISCIATGANAAGNLGAAMSFYDYNYRYNYHVGGNYGVYPDAGTALSLNADIMHIDKANTVKPDVRVILHSGVGRANKGTVKTPTLTAIESATVVLSGRNPYYLRVYDCSLTNEQMLQNHFADLCYYYGLEEETAALLGYGSYILGEAFYLRFSDINIGDENAKSNIQAIINEYLTAAATVDVAKLADLIKAKYDIVYRASVSIAADIATIDSMISEIDGKIAEADSMTVAPSAADIIEDCRTQLTTIKNNVNRYKKQAVALQKISDAAIAKITAISSAITNPDTLETYIGGASEAQLLELLGVLDEVVDTCSVDGSQSFDADSKVMSVSAAETAYLSRNAAIASADVAGIYNYMLSASAITSVSVDDYIKFAFMQTRVLDFAGMRAIFTVDDEAIADGYTYEQYSYDVAAYGFIMAPAASSIADIAVEYNAGKVTSSTSGAKIIASESASGTLSINSRYAVNDSARAQAIAKTGVNGSVYEMRNELHSVPYSEQKAAYEQKYMYRAFIVLEGADTQFISYLDVYSRTLESSAISLYDVAGAAASQVTDSRYLLPELYISKVIFKVTGEIPTKED